MTTVTTSKTAKTGFHYLEMFNQTVTKLPPLIDCNFGKSFNQSIDELPDSIERLTLCDAFNQKVSKFPASLKTLWCKTSDIQKHKDFFKLRNKNVTVYSSSI